MTTLLLTLGVSLGLLGVCGLVQCLVWASAWNRVRVIVQVPKRIGVAAHGGRGLRALQRATN